MSRLLKVSSTFVFLLLISPVAFSQSRTMYVGDVELRLGTSREVVMRNLTPKYSVTAVGETSFTVSQYDQQKKHYNYLGVIGFDNNQLSYISRDIDTSGWPNDEGFAVARAIYEAINNSIPVTDRDGAKRASANIVVSSKDASRPRANLRIIDIYINDQRIDIIILDGEDGKSISASVAIQAKPW
jgi:hypothetical protein